jgi:hypothetical protein
MDLACPSITFSVKRKLKGAALTILRNVRLDHVLAQIFKPALTTASSPEALSKSTPLY